MGSSGVICVLRRQGLLMLKFCFYSVLALFVAGASGCNTLGRGGDAGADAPVEPKDTLGMEVVAYGTGLLLSPNQRFNDVPLPMGAEEDIARTYVFESSSLKIGRMVYVVKEPVSALAQFYAKECPTAGWNLEHVTQANGAELTFRKPGHRLLVTVKPRGGLSRSVDLILHLTPDDGAGSL